MAVVLADGSYVLHRQARPSSTRDAHGTPVHGGTEPPVGPADGAAARRADGSWALRLDPALWPVAVGDVVVREGDGRRWVITGTPLLHEVPNHPDVDHAAVTGVQEPPDVDRGYPTRG
jgi:hypothetical protein